MGTNTSPYTNISLNFNGKLQAAEELKFSAFLIIFLAEISTQKYIWKMSA